MATPISSLSSLADLIRKWRAVLPGQREDSPDSASSPAEAEADTVQPPSQPSWWAKDWAPDAYMPGYENLTYHMPGYPHLAEEGEGYLTATLIRRGEDRGPRAVLYLHGWNDYFFQDHLAQFWSDLGYDFYAIDLHRYGRSLHGDELPGYITSVTDYYDELDAAVAYLKQHHQHVLLNGHSTGGLIAALWTAARPGQLAGLVLNSPWLDLMGSLLVRTLAPGLAKGLTAAHAPTVEFPKSESDIYARSLHRAFNGEWNFDLALKRPSSNPIRPGWLNAITRGQDQVAAGLDIDVPVLVALSGRSSVPKSREDPDIDQTDIIIDVERVVPRLSKLGWHVTIVRLTGALHDITLSSQDVRDRFFDEIRRWDLAYVRSRKAQDEASRREAAGLSAGEK